MEKINRFGIISYNIYCNFTNYGSALQSWALSQAINKVPNCKSMLIDYCPDVLKNLDPLNPFANMWDKDEESRRMCELTLPAIRENYKKFDKFYKTRFDKTKNKYTSENFNNVMVENNIDGFVCGSDTIFCIDEFKGFDDGYYANYPCMKNGYSVAYAASFGDAHFNDDTYRILNDRLNNFKAIGLRENAMVDYVRNNVSIPVEKVIDPTLLLTSKEYDVLAEDRLIKEKYVLLYARRYNKKMEEYADKIAEENGWKVVEISLRATNADRHQMFYEAGVEEFLSLVKNAEVVVTNSFHGAIFSVQYKRPFYVFSREQCDSKIDEVLQLFGLRDRLMINGEENIESNINWDDVHKRIDEARNQAFNFLINELTGIDK
ncbi:MAG: polysaccharide pyruvyl transferase family protein [Treponema sp.]|nr:polysaccharide pyruvyl transferase family protein [Treponema sp.]